jgi:DNA end-binding protein Ku
MAKAKNTSKTETPVAAPAKPSVADLSSKLNNLLHPKVEFADVNAAAPEKVGCGRSTWSGKLVVIEGANGLTVPVKTYKVIEDSEKFKTNMIHQCNHEASEEAPVYGQLKQGAMKCEACEAIVERAQSLKGMKDDDGKFFVITDDEKKGCMVLADKVMTVEKLVPATEVDPLYFEAAEYLGADGGSIVERALAVFREMLVSTGQVAVAQTAQRGREQTVIIRPLKVGLAVHFVYFEHEIRIFDKVAPVVLSEDEKTLAKQLGEAMSDKFVSSDYNDKFSIRFRNLLTAKKAGVAAPEVKKQDATAVVTVDLMAALKASLANKKAAKAGK